MKSIITAIAVVAVPAMVLATTPKATTTTTTTTTSTATEATATTWTGTLAGVTAENHNMIKDAIAKIPGVEKVSVETTGKTSITGKNFTESQVAAVLPVGVTVKK